MYMYVHVDMCVCGCIYVKLYAYIWNIFLFVFLFVLCTSKLLPEIIDSEFKENLPLGLAQRKLPHWKDLHFFLLPPLPRSLPRHWPLIREAAVGRVGVPQDGVQLRQRVAVSVLREHAVGVAAALLHERLVALLQLEVVLRGEGGGLQPSSYY